ncbi:MAG: aspartate--tRNA ligase [Thermaerobacter sp.]|nr:aspartate--tRNA ligase [Thermaerobacter sp.]
MRRTHYCGELGLQQVGDEVVLNGWVHRRRDHGGVIFVDLRDRSGWVQLVFNPDRPEAFRVADTLRSEYVLEVRGRVVERAPELVNPKIPTGAVEVVPREVTVLAQAEPSPVPVAEEDEEVDEVVRLRYRYLDLRRPAMVERLALRHRVTQAIRRYLDDQGFWEVETPMLTRSTPEVERDFLVPSRVAPGRFYALPQSPQLFKQLLMVAGVDRYYQIARCFRDEDLRADRQPEFTQVDLEMSFPDPEDVMAVTEGLLGEALRSAGAPVPPYIPRLTWAEAMERFGSDKPDLRLALEIRDLSAAVADCSFGVFRTALERGGRVRGITAPGLAGATRRELEELTELATAAGAGGLAWLAFGPEGVRSPVAKFFTPEQLERLREGSRANSGDLLLLVADRDQVASPVLGRLRGELARRLELVPSDAMAFVWVTDFPLLEYDQEERRLVAMHHPFTAPREEDLARLETEPLAVRARAYDLVLNGVELGGGSIRIHRPDLQRRIFALIGMSPAEAADKFGFLLEAFRHGAPPHGGIALGLDRLVMLLGKAASIREVIAFPKTARGNCPLTEAPAAVSPAQLRELHLKLPEPGRRS